MPAYNRDAAARAAWASDGSPGCADRNMLEHVHDRSNRALSVWRSVLSHHSEPLFTRIAGCPAIGLQYSVARPSRSC